MQGSCNNINNPYVKLYVPDVIKDMNIKVFNLMSMYLGMRLVHVNADQMQVFVMINDVGIMINVDVNAKN